MKFATGLSFLLIFFVIAEISAAPPVKNKGIMKDYQNEFWNEIKASIDEYKSNDSEPKLSFKMDYTGIELPKSTKEFTQYWHNAPISQGSSGMCWCYSTTSLLESEMYRIHDKKIKLSELYTVYWEYVEKARRYIQTHGESYFAEGSQANAVLRIWKKYGCVPADVYTGIPDPELKFHNHGDMSSSIRKYLNSLKESNAWNEEIALSTVKSILNYYIGEPPSEFEYQGKKYTPIDFMNNVTKIKLDDYVDIMSLFEHPYWEYAEYDVPDNWWDCDSYINVPLDDFMESLIKAAENGYTIFIGGDVSESGYSSHDDVAMVPSYDIPSDYIDEYARQFRFSNKTTTDDHGIHIVGYKKDKKGDYWFLIKDSGSGARNGKNSGYYFYHQDYVKLKMMNFMVHKDAVQDLLKKFDNSK